MGRRSRKRSISGSLAEREPRAAAPAPPPRTPATLRRRAPSEERPPAPWGAFPLGELTTLAGIVLIVVGFASRTFRLLAVGFALVALAACELALREHVNGFRSHSSLLGLLAGFVAGAALVTAGAPRIAVLAAAAVAFVATFLAMRRLFMRKTGGLGFRA
jgi:uncharacterized membrane protein YphA (DoxX/SURF4 family)